jgi:signal transduction histidine kinase
MKTFLAQFQDRLSTVDIAAVTSKMEASEEILRDEANTTLYRVQQAVGLRPKGN